MFRDSLILDIETKEISFDKVNFKNNYFNIVDINAHLDITSNKFVCPTFRIKNNLLVDIITPVSPLGDLFFRYFDKKIYFSISLYNLLKQSQKLKLDHRSINFFIKKGYFPPGKTYFENIKRLVPSSNYKLELSKKFFFRKNKLDIINFPIKGKIDCSFNLEGLELKLKDYIESKTSKYSNVGLLLSGGIDSTTLLNALSRFCNSSKITAYSLCCSPKLSIVEKDLIIAKKTCLEHGIKHKVIFVNYKDFNTKLLDKIINYIPQVSNLSIDFYYIVNQLKSDGITDIFSGQNLDNLYGFGATTSFSFNRSGIIDLLKRFFLTEEFCESINLLKYKRTNILSRITYKYFSDIICFLFSLYFKKKYRLPLNKKEFCASISFSAYGLPFVERQKQVEIIKKFNPKKVTPKELIDLLSQEKYKTYMMSSDSLLLKELCLKNNIFPHFIYSSQEFSFFWKKQILNFEKFLFKPKDLLYQYLKKYYPNYFKKPKTKSCDGYSLEPHNWAKKLLKDEFNLLEKNLEQHKETKSLKFINFEQKPTHMRRLSILLSFYWVNQFLKKTNHL